MEFSGRAALHVSIRMALQEGLAERERVGAGESGDGLANFGSASKTPYRSQADTGERSPRPAQQRKKPEREDDDSAT